MGAVTKIEPIPLPSPDRPERMPPLPAWLVSQRNALGLNLQMVKGQYREVVTLPSDKMPNEAQRNVIENHYINLTSLLSQTPENDPVCGEAVVVLITKMMMVLPGQRTSEEGAEAKGEAYLMALEDLPAWALQAAIRRWYRKESGLDDRGRPFDYRWMPDPSTLRGLVIREIWPVKERADHMRVVLDAMPFVDSAADLEKGRLAMRGLLQKLGDEDAMRRLTFDDAVAAGGNAQGSPTNQLRPM